MFDSYIERFLLAHGWIKTGHKFENKSINSFIAYTAENIELPGGVKFKLTIKYKSPFVKRIQIIKKEFLRREALQRYLFNTINEMMKNWVKKKNAMLWRERINVLHEMAQIKQDITDDGDVEDSDIEVEENDK